MLLFSPQRQELFQEISLSETFTASSHNTHPRSRWEKIDSASTDFTCSSSHQVFTFNSKAVWFPLQPVPLDPATEQVGVRACVLMRIDQV